MPVEAPFFDRRLGAWVLSRHCDVTAALRDARLSAPGARSDDAAAELDRAAHEQLRAAARVKLSPRQLASWREPVRSLARDLLDPPAGAVEIVSQFAIPWSRRVAALVCRVPEDDIARLAALAADVFAAAAEPFDESAGERAAAATVALARSFAGELVALEIQAFVALAESLPRLVANACLALVENPGETARLRADPRLLPNAVEELLRYAGPSRAQLRRAVVAASYGNAPIGAGDRVLLMLAEANRDPAVFADPDLLDLGRDASGHVAFGAGPHACVGGLLVRMALAAALEVFAARFSSARSLSAPEWSAALGIRAVARMEIEAV
jgi:cytochrome P450